MLIDQSNNTGAFNGLAENYDKFRPTYPNQVFGILDMYLKGRESLNNKIIVDMACGTGIATRKLYDFFSNRYRIIGVEPGADMLSKAQESSNGDYGNIDYLPGSAENIPFADQQVDCIVVAQAIQWFDRSAFYKEAHRVLKNNGLLVIIQNNRNWRENKFLNDYEYLLENENEHYNRGYRDIDIIREINETKLLKSLFYGCVKYTKLFNFDEFLGMSSSSTKVKYIMDRIGFDQYKEKLFEVFSAYQNSNGINEVLYDSEVYIFEII